MNKRAAGSMSDMVLMVYRVLLILFVGIAIFVITGMSYSNDLNVKDTESVILARNVYNCLIDNKILLQGRLDDLDKKFGGKILEYCGYNNTNNEFSRMFVNVTIDGLNKAYIQGEDSSWILETMQYYEKNPDTETYEEMKKQNSIPGYTNMDFIVKYNNKDIKLNIITLVIDE